jgi:DNA ligase-1
MPTPFRSLCELCERLAATTKRLQMIDQAASFLKTLDPPEIEPAVSMILGRPFPKWDQRVLELSWATVSGIIKQLTSLNWSDFRSAYSQTGDVGSAVETVFESSKLRKQATLFEKPLSILEVRRTFEDIAEASGQGSRERKERLVETMLGQASPLETKYFIKITISEMRTGFHEGLMEAAVAKAFEVSLEAVQTASMLIGDVGETASILKVKGSEGLANLGFRVFRPIKLMMAQMAGDVNEALKEAEGPLAFEYKLDGARIQIHKSGDRVRIFSRRLTDVTESLPEIADLVRSQIKANEAILEGEVIALGKDRASPLLFQHLMRRFRRVHGIDNIAKEIPLELQLFDIIYYDGESLIDVPYEKRRRRLTEIVGKIPITKQIVTDNPQQAKDFLDEALNSGHEGLVAKRLSSPYTPGIRGKRWFKIKQTLDPLDLVIVAAEWGYGRRHRWLSDYYLAARDAETGELITLGKTFKGLTDDEIIGITERLKRLIVREEPHLVVVMPRIVVEVAYNEIQKSPKYDCGMTLRFARIARIRDDKSPDDADTIQRVREIYEKQFEKKAKF